VRTGLLVAVGLGVLALPGAVWGQEWAGFRGPGGTGVADEKALPLEWGADKNVAWKAKAPGTGWSSPIVWGDKVFITAASSDQDRRPRVGGGGRGGPGGPGRDGFGPGGGPPNATYRWEVFCLDRGTGKVLWKELALEGRPRIPKQASNTYATETPVTDGERVYAYFGMTGVFCYDLSGKLLWKKDLGAYATDAGHGTASSPALDRHRLFLQIDNEEKSFLVALDGRTGEELWRAARDERTNYSSPVVWKNKVRTELVAAGSNKVRSYDPATGKVLWELGVGGGRCPASPVGDDERLYVGGGRGDGRGGPGGGFGGGGGGLFAVRAGTSGDATLKRGDTSNTGVEWSQSRASLDGPSPLAYKGQIYVLGQGAGFLSCFDARTGKQVYRERLPNARGFWASPCAGDGKVFCLDTTGTTYVVQAGPEFKLLSQNRIADELWASPAVAGGSLILRGVDSVYCLKP
jgi:outer membrane protein assembly factor BamB